MDAGPMEVRVTPHSSLSSWDGRGAGQTKAKADGGGGVGTDEKESYRDREREKEKLTKKSKRSCQLPSDEDRGGRSEKGDIT